MELLQRIGTTFSSRTVNVFGRIRHRQEYVVREMSNIFALALIIY